jgi:hypothetical protein
MWINIPTATTTGFVTVNNNPPYTYTGLTADTCYNFYVRAVCSTSDIGLWSTSANLQLCKHLQHVVEYLQI